MSDEQMNEFIIQMDKEMCRKSFEYFFVDDDLANQYVTEERWQKIVTYSSLLAIIIACLGLFGLAVLAVGRRTKEIGIRKAMGASVGEVVVLLSKDFTRLVLVSLVIAIPAGYFGMATWLDGFVYKTDLGVSAFLISGLMALGIAWLTVSYQSIKAARANPIKALRHG